MSVLENDAVCKLLRQAWRESEPETAGAHEEGGFVLRDADGTISVERWPHGAQNEIAMPRCPGGKRGSFTVIATFHTHPNPEPDFQQEPSLTDIRAVRLDPDLGHAEYEGEYVISSAIVYLILRNGQVKAAGKTDSILGSD